MRFSRGRNAVATAAALVIVFGVGWAAAQEPDRELTATFYEPLKVRLVNVNVVATDSDGVPIRGLTESDFEIFEDGQTVEISHFLAADPQAGGVVGDEARTAPDEALQPNVHITVECQEQELRGKGEYLVPVMIQIPIGELVLQPAAESHVAQISVASVVRDDKGRMSDVHEREYPIEIANDQLLYAVGQRAEFVVGMVLRGGPHRISISVRDEQSSIESTEFVDVEVGNVTGETGR